MSQFHLIEPIPSNLSDPVEYHPGQGLHVVGYQVVALQPVGATWGAPNTHTLSVGNVSVELGGLEGEGGQGRGGEISHGLDEVTVEQMEGRTLTYAVYAVVGQDQALGGGDLI